VYSFAHPFTPPLGREFEIHAGHVIFLIVLVYSAPISDPFGTD
jgi:hypothetical protein